MKDGFIFYGRENKKGNDPFRKVNRVNYYYLGRFPPGVATFLSYVLNSWFTARSANIINYFVIGEN